MFSFSRSNLVVPPGLERSTTSARLTTLARSEPTSPSSVPQSCLTNQSHPQFYFESIRREARQCAAEIRVVELRVFVDLAREKTSAQRAIRNQSDPKFLESWNHFLLRLSPPERIFILERGHRLDGVCAPMVSTPASERPKCFASLLNQFLHRAGDVSIGSSDRHDAGRADRSPRPSIA